MITDFIISPVVSLDGATHAQRQDALNAETETGLTARYVRALGESRGDAFRCQLGTVVTEPWTAMVNGTVYRGKAPHFLLKSWGATFAEAADRLKTLSEA